MDLATLWNWILGVSCFSVYLVSIFTVAFVTFRKGYTVLGILGLFFPILWLIGAVLPAKTGSPFDKTEVDRYKERFEEQQKLIEKEGKQPQ